MYEVEFYRDKDGESDIVNYLDDLLDRYSVSKTDRINYDKIIAYFKLLEQHGTYIGMPAVRHIIDDIWELRPLKNRFFFFYWKDNRFVVLSHYMKKGDKAPPREIKKAQTRRKDHIERYGD